jgi:hypothetical protein
LSEFAPVEGREVVASFDVARSPRMPARFCWVRRIERSGCEEFPACFHDERRAHVIEQEVVTLGQCVFAIASAMKTSGRR